MNYLTLRDVEELKPSELIEKIILAEIISYKLSHCSETFKAETEHNGVMCKLELDKRLNSL